MNPETQKAVTWYANKYGYQVEVLERGQIIHEYFAGNHPHDSEEVLEPSDPLAVPEQEIRQFAQSTAEQIADEFSIPVSMVSEIID
jgi:hypothetical protein